MSKQNNSNINVIKNVNLKRFTLDFIARSYPEWVNPDGSCPKCENFYENELDNLVEVVTTGSK